MWPEFEKLIARDAQSKALEEGIDVAAATAALGEQLRALMEMLTGSIEPPLDTDPSREPLAEDGAALTSIEMKETPELEALRKAISDEAQKDLGSYGNAYRELAKEIDLLAVEMRTIFYQSAKSEREVGLKSGLKLNAGQVIKNIIGSVPEQKQRNFERSNLADRSSHAVSLLIDLSGSMSGEKIEQTFKATVLLGEVLHRIGVPYEILGFNAALLELKLFHIKHSEGVKTKISEMTGAVHGTLARYTDTGWALAACADRIRQGRKKNQMIFLLSDGAPNPSPDHNAPMYELGGVVAQLAKEPRLRVFGLGLGAGTAGLKAYLRESLVEIPATSLVRQLSKLVLGKLGREE